MSTPSKPWKPGRRERRVLLVLLIGYPAAEKYLGFDGHPSTVYVVLDRLERSGWVAEQEGRRRFYRLTPYGRAEAMKALGLKTDNDGGS